MSRVFFFCLRHGFQEKWIFVPFDVTHLKSPTTRVHWRRLTWSSGLFRTENNYVYNSIMHSQKSTSYHFERLYLWDSNNDYEDYNLQDCYAVKSGAGFTSTVSAAKQSFSAVHFPVVTTGFVSLRTSVSSLGSTTYPSECITTSYAYWTVHHLDIWIKVDHLDDTCFIIYCSTCFRR